MNKIATVVFLSLLIFNVVIASQENFNVTYYEIDIAIDPVGEIVSGSVTVQALSKIVGLTAITLDFYDNMQVDSVIGNAQSYVHANDVIEISLDNVYNNEELFEVTVFYHGHPDSRATYARPMVFQQIAGCTIVCTESCPYYARCWWPCKDTPSDKPDSVDIKVTAPEKYIVASNGVRMSIESVEGDLRTHHWQVKNPIATYLITITLYEYYEFSDVYVNAHNDTLPLMYFVFPHSYTSAVEKVINLVPDMIEILSRYYGEYPYPDEKYGMAQYVGDWAAMEYQTLSCFNSSYISDEETVLHELSHQWWGDCVTPANFHHTWISEGFAVFSEALYWGEVNGVNAYFNHMNSMTTNFTKKDTLYQHDISNPYEVYPAIVYYKGAWVLHMLRHVLGDSLYWESLHQYFDLHKYSSATTEDLQAACEAVYGESLEWFFHQWVYEPSYPTYNFGWWQEELENSNYKISGFIDRVDTDFKMPLDVTAKTELAESTQVVWVDDSTAYFEIILDQPATDVTLDEHNWVLKTATEMTNPDINYFYHDVNDSSGNNNGLADPGEAIILWVSVINRGIVAEDISVSLTTADSSIQIGANSEIFEKLKHNQKYNCQFTFTVTPNAEGHLSELELHINATNGYSAVETFYLEIGEPIILLVDDDNGMNYEQYFFESLYFAKAYAGTWDVASRGCPTNLQDYAAVIWFTGDDRTTSLTPEEQQVLADYLDNGGRLFITGQNIGYDLVADGTVADSTFYANYLHAKYISDSTDTYIVYFVPGNPISNGLFFYLGGAGNQTAPSVIDAIDGASLIFKWVPGYTGAGLYYEDPTAHYRIVYLAFGFEGLDEPMPESKGKLLTNILDWLAVDTQIHPAMKNLNTPAKFQLSQNYPNPFNHATTIHYQIPKTEFVQIDIYNLMGQKIRTLVSKQQQPNYYKITWNGKDDNGTMVASGVYIYRIRAGYFNQSNKLLFLK